jgi:tetratricopeptide (TPR) repeat protein
MNSIPNKVQSRTKETPDLKQEYLPMVSGNGDLKALKCRLEGYISRGEYLSAYSLIKKALHQYPDDGGLLRSYALCMTRLGMCEEAISVLEQVVVASDDNPETFAQLGSLYKTAWLASCSTGDCSSELLQKAYNYYNSGYESDGNYWSGINVATLAMLLGQENRACSVADEVIAKCWNIYNNQGTYSQFWIPATLAEAYLIKGDIKNASNWYRTASHHLGDALGNIRTTVNNSKLLMDKIEVSEEERNLLQSSLSLPRIGLLFGDRHFGSDRRGCFPTKLSERTLTKLRKGLAELRLNIAITGIKDGLDIAVLEFLQNMGKKTYVILPSSPEYTRKSLHEIYGEEWIERFDKVLSHASGVESFSSAKFDSRSLFVSKLTDDFMLRIAIDRAEHLGGEIVPVEIGDGRRQSSERTSHMLGKLASACYESVFIPLSGVNSGINSSAKKQRVYPDGDTITDQADEGFPPRLCVIVVIGLGDVSSLMEFEITDLIDEIGNTVSTHTGRTIRQLFGGVLTDRLYIQLNSLDTALGLERKLRAVDSCRNLPIFIHADIAVRISHGAGMYCRSLDDCLQLVELIQPGSTCCTMQARSFSDSLDSNVKFCYRGNISLDNDAKVQIYEVSDHSSDHRKRSGTS